MIVADVDTPIICMDFLVYYVLLIDPKNKRFIDLETGFTTQWRLASGKHISIKIIEEYLGFTLTPVASKDHIEQEEHLQLLCKCLSEYGLVLNSRKCIFGENHVKFLG